MKNKTTKTLKKIMISNIILATISFILATIFLYYYLFLNFITLIFLGVTQILLYKNNELVISSMPINSENKNE